MSNSGINASATYSTLAGYWLDTTAPQDDDSQTGLVLPTANQTIFLVNDIPSIPLVTGIIASGSTYHSGGVIFEEDFLLFIYAKPEKPDAEYYSSIWFPIAVYNWGWKGSASYSLIDAEWHTDTSSNLIKTLTEINVSSFSSWPDMVETGVYKPKWRDF